MANKPAGILSEYTNLCSRLLKDVQGWCRVAIRGLLYKTDHLLLANPCYTGTGNDTGAGTGTDMNTGRC